MMCTLSIPTRLNISLECDEDGSAEIQDIRAALIVAIEQMSSDEICDLFEAGEDFEEEDTGGDGNSAEDAYDSAEVER